MTIIVNQEEAKILTDIAEGLKIDLNIDGGRLQVNEKFVNGKLGSIAKGLKTPLRHSILKRAQDIIPIIEQVLGTDE